MVKVKDVFEQNQEEKDTIYIHLTKEKKDKYDPVSVGLWDGWLKDIPDAYMELEVVGTGQSLKDLENGIIGFYVETKAIEENINANNTKRGNHMDKLSLLDELLVKVNTGEIKTDTEDNEVAAKILSEIRQVIEAATYAEIVQDVTDLHTGYFAPEYPSWKHYLNDCNGYEDYRTVLEQAFTNEELEALWQNSHIEEEMTEAQIKEDICKQIGQLKMIQLVQKTSTMRNPKKVRTMIEGMKARIIGLYNILYE